MYRLQGPLQAALLRDQDVDADLATVPRGGRRRGGGAMDRAAPKQQGTRTRQRDRETERQRDGDRQRDGETETGREMEAETETERQSTIQELTGNMKPSQLKHETTDTLTP